MTRALAACASLLCLLLAACSTPQAALDQANATAGLSAAFNAELEAYRKDAARVARARIESIRRQEALIARLAEIDAWNTRTSNLAGMGEIDEQRKSLIALADSRASDEAATRRRLAELDAELAALVKPVPSASAKLEALQAALAELGTELPLKERLELLADAAKTVRDEIRKNRAATADAQAKTATATVPPAPREPQP